MPVIRCPISNCEYSTEDVDPAIAAALLMVHNNVHSTATGTALAPARQRAPKIPRPNIGTGSNEEHWNSFLARWGMFKRSTNLSPHEIIQQLFECCEEELGNNILKCHPTAVTQTEEHLLAIVKRMAVTPIAISVKRSDLLATKQDHGEKTRSFFARINGKAATCSYVIDCNSDTCTNKVDFTDIIVKDVLISGLIDDDIKKDVLGCPHLDTQTVQETVSFIEAKEMARDALTKPTVNAAISSYKSTKKSNDNKGDTTKTNCQVCKSEIDKYSWSKRQHRMVECTLCLPCWKASHPRRNKSKRLYNKDQPRQAEFANETGAVMIGACENKTSEILTIRNACAQKPIILDHLIFENDIGWKVMEKMQHPTINLQLQVDDYDYAHIHAPTPKLSTCQVTAVTDTGAQSCLWSLTDFRRCGFKDSDLIPVKRTLLAANRDEIQIEGAIFIRLSGKDKNGLTHTAPVMVYVSPDTTRFYLSRNALVQLKIISDDFPRIGAALETSIIEHQKHSCGCPLRTLPPARPKELPFPCTSDNNERMKGWLIHYYGSSTFNKCAHQLLPGMTGPPIKLHIDPSATPYAAHTPASVPLHWQKEVEQQLMNDVALGVIEEVPIGEPSLWCHRMVLVKKPDGTPRRTVDLSGLNRHCLRETHHIKPPFKQACQIPADTWKSVTDAWNGYHSVPLRVEDRHLTTFITHIGRFRYKVAPQGFLASGDGYSRRFDEIISDITQKTKIVDDTALWDSDLTSHWWRMIDFLERVGQNGIILNREKFQFAQRSINFAGFRITEKQIRPQDKFLSAIREFPTPSKTTDVRSWFGLVNQISHFSQLTEMMQPFKPLLSPKSKFIWTEQMNEAFQQSKAAIVASIQKGVEIFDLSRRTCLRPDWSKTGIGFFLSQKHCNCTSTQPGCCEFGWRITLAGSRFLKPAETRYAPVEGEALAIAWSLEQTKYFTQGCDNLLIITDHKPLVKLLGDKMLDEISNPRLFRLKQRTLMWRFDIVHMPGKGNFFADATSRNPINNANEDDIEITSSESLSSIRCSDSSTNIMELQLISNSHDMVNKIRAITWMTVLQACETDETAMQLKRIIESGFPDKKTELPLGLSEFWEYRTELYIVDDLIFYKQRVFIPPCLRPEVLDSLHSAHQGVTSMNERAKVTVFWPGITKDIQKIRDHCQSCNRIAPSQARIDPHEPWIPKAPFEAIACDYFTYQGRYYFVAADRLSGWTEQSLIKVGTAESGAAGLVKALRQLFLTFGVPVEVSSDGGPEFVSKETKAFFEQWGIHHRLSSAHLPSANGRAELAVKSTKRLLMDNTSRNGDLNNDRMVRALLTQRNTPDPGCKLSPAEILFGRKLKDALPYIRKHPVIFFNQQMSNQWTEMWEQKETALRTRYVKTMENLGKHSRKLPPLSVGDHVFIQNQQGQFPIRWDRTGVIVEVKEFDQYLIKVDGTGRITLRNRRYLRCYDPPAQRTKRCDPYNVITDIEKPPMVTTSPSRDHQENRSSEAVSTPLPPARVQRNLTEPNTLDENRAKEIISSPVHQTPKKQLFPPDIESNQAPSNHEPSSVVQSPCCIPDPQLRRSTRLRQPKKFYDPSSGSYTEQNPI